MQSSNGKIDIIDLENEKNSAEALVNDNDNISLNESNAQSKKSMIKNKKE